jgi:UPF0755 protein
VILVVVLILLGGFFGTNKAYDLEIAPNAPGDETPVSIEIPSGSTTADIARILKENKLIGSSFFMNRLIDKVLGEAFLYKSFSKRQGYDGRYKEGRYILTRAMDADEIAGILIEGTVAETKTFTIPEGYTNKQVAAKLANDGICTEEEFWEEVRSGDFDYNFLEGSPEGDERLEGFLSPNTYEVYADASAHDVIDKMLAQFNEGFLPTYYDRVAEMNMSVRDIVTVASLIERETMVDSEREVIARVIYNRLDDDWPLQIDATIQYLLPEQKEFLLNADLEIDSPYNTYKYHGLPPGPICNPRMDSVVAALYPDDNDYFYYVLSADLDGTHRFSETQSEFERNKQEYYAAVEEQGAQEE